MSTESLTSGTNPGHSDVSHRQHWMSVLARADERELEGYWQTLPDRPGYHYLRPPQVGLAMVRGRTGGTGSAFNLGEVTVSRCVVELDSGTHGFGYVRGRSRRHAELAAVLDAMLLDRTRADAPALIESLYTQWQQQRGAMSRKAAATKVDFMTMVRGS